MNFVYKEVRGPFVYRLGRQVFNLERGVRFPYGMPFSSENQHHLDTHHAVSSLTGVHQFVSEQGKPFNKGCTWFPAKGLFKQLSRADVL